VLIRLIAVNQSLWLDEAIGALVVKERGFWDIAINFPKGDNHPPLYYMALDIWSKMFGYSETALRSLSILFAVVTIWLTFKIVKLLELDNKTKLPEIVAAFLATSGFFIYYSQEARMYMMASFLTTVLIYSYLKLLKSNGNTKSNAWWIFFSLATTSLIFTDYVPVFLLPVFWIYALISKQRFGWWKKFVTSHIPTLLLGILWLPTLVIQSERGKWLLQTLPAWQNLSGGATVKQVILVWVKFVIGRLSFTDKYFYYPLVAIVTFPFAFLLVKALKNYKNMILIWLWLFLPLILVFLVSFVFPAFIYFRFVFVYPAFSILICYGLVKIKSKSTRNCLLAIILLINISFASIYLFNESQKRENWRDATTLVKNICKIENSCVVIFTNPEPFAPARYYSNRETLMVGANNSISASKFDTFTKTRSELYGIKEIFYFNYLQDLHDPNNFVLTAIEELGYYKTGEEYSFSGIGKILHFIKT
jgi:uncharacterized membrane protein